MTSYEQLCDEKQVIEREIAGMAPSDARFRLVKRLKDVERQIGSARRQHANEQPRHVLYTILREIEVRPGFLSLEEAVAFKADVAKRARRALGFVS